MAAVQFERPSATLTCCIDLCPNSAVAECQSLHKMQQAMWGRGWGSERVEKTRAYALWFCPEHRYVGVGRPGQFRPDRKVAA